MKQILLFQMTLLCILMSVSTYAQYKVDEERIYSWDEDSGAWEQDVTQAFTYDNEGDKETELLATATPTSQNLFRQTKSYDANNNIIETLYYVWNTSSMDWQIMSKTTYNYDGAQNLISENSQSYNPAIMTYINSWKKTYTYTGGNLSTETSQDWNIATSSWVNSSKTLYEYSGSNRTKITEQDWDSGTNAWVNDDQTEIAYDSAGKMTQTIIKEWDTGSNAWTFDERITYTYTMDMLTEATNEDYNNGAWELSARTLITYDDGLATEAIYQERQGSEWLNENRVVTAYDANGNPIIIISEEWDKTGNVWELEGKIERDYSEVKPFTLGIDSFKIEDMKVFPNPATDVINVSSVFNIDKMELYDVLGKKVKSTQEGNQIQLDDLNSGMYVLKVFQKDFSKTQRILVK